MLQLWVLMGVCVCVVEQRSSDVPMGMAVGMPQVKGLPAAVDLAKNPLSETHEFRQACSLCYVRTGELVLPALLSGLGCFRSEVKVP